MKNGKIIFINELVMYFFPIQKKFFFVYVICQKNSQIIIIHIIMVKYLIAHHMYAFYLKSS